MGFANLHVFPYSPRPGTRATQTANMIKDREKKQRTHIMLSLANRSSQRFQERFLGQSINVLWEGKKNGVWFGLTDNYLRIFLRSREPLANELLPTNIVAQKEDGLWGI